MGNASKCMHHPAAACVARCENKPNKDVPSTSSSSSAREGECIVEPGGSPDLVNVAGMVKPVLEPAIDRDFGMQKTREFSTETTRELTVTEKSSVREATRESTSERVPSLDFKRIKTKPADYQEHRQPFQVELKREGPNWSHIGFKTVGRDDDPTYLAVDRVWAPSLISEWNTAHSARRSVKAGDIIVAANGKRGNMQALLDEIQSVSAGGSLVLDVEPGWPAARTEPKKGTKAVGKAAGATK